MYYEGNERYREVHTEDAEIIQPRHYRTFTLQGCIIKVICIANPREMEDNMENLVSLGQFFSGLGVFFVGIGVLWFVSVYKPKEK